MPGINGVGVTTAPPLLVVVVIGLDVIVVVEVGPVDPPPIVEVPLIVTVLTGVALVTTSVLTQT